MAKVNKFYSDFHRLRILGGILAIVLFCLTAPTAHAKEEPGGLDRASLQSLAHSFVARIGGGLKAYDEKKEQEERSADPLSQIPDGETLLLRPKSGDFVMQTDMAALKHGNTIYYDLEDLLAQLELPVDYMRDKKIGSGWFLREDWLIRFDFNKGEVVSRNESYQVQPGDTFEESGTLYISGPAAKTWMSIEMTPDIQQQYVEIKTPFPYPALARNDRQKRGKAQASSNAPVLPRLKTEEKMLDINTLETQHNLRVVKSEDKKATTSYRNVTSAQGDLLRHNFYGVGFWDKDDKLTGVRTRFSRDEEDPVLLGPLKARYYGFGDVDTTQIPLAGGSTQELGFRVNNNPLRNADFQTTTISGDSLPGWDVELYRDGAYVARQSVDDTARYEFEDIQLYAGDNLFEVFFYGPQGEIRSDQFNIPVNQDFLATQDNTYDVSLSFKNTQTYNKFADDSEDANTPVLSTRYNKYIGKTLTYAGLRSSQIQGNRKVYVAGGFTHLWNGYIFDGNLAMDEKAATAEELTVRKNIDEWRIILNAHARSEDYISDGDAVNLLGFNGTATKNFNFANNIYSTVTFDADYKKTSRDSSENGGGLSLSGQVGRFSLTNLTKYRQYESGAGIGSSYSRIDDSVSVRYNLGKIFLRAGLDYNVHPDSEVERYFGEATYYVSNTFNTNLSVQNDPVRKYTQAQLNLNYIHDKFRVTPYAKIDTNNRMEAGLRLSTSLIDDPNKAVPIVTSQRVLGRGQVSTFVFFDKNGNNLFDGNDEPLPDVIVESLNIKRRVKTDESGYSLIRDLPEKYATDIHIDESSLPDPFMVSGFEGVSILPHAGQMVDLTFPVHMAGEITGSVFIKDKEGKTEAPRMKIQLIPVDGRSTDIATAITAEDGYYELSPVRPGNYLLIVNPQDAQREDAGGGVPKSIRIGYEGTMLSSMDFELQRGRRQVAVKVEDYKGMDFNRPFFAMDTGGREDRSRLAMLLEKMVERKYDVDAQEGLSPIAIEGHENLKVLPGADWAAHYNRCQQLNDDHIPCKLILFVPDRDANVTKTAQK